MKRLLLLALIPLFSWAGEPNDKIHVKDYSVLQDSEVVFYHVAPKGGMVVLLKGDTNGICTELPGTQALLFLEPDRKTILDEGCWLANGDTLILDTAKGSHFERPKGFYDEVL